MRSTRGFTLAEMMVALLLLGLLFTSVISFMIFQKTYGGAETRKRTGRETLSLASQMIKNDVLHAAYGVADHPELGIYVTDPYPTSGNAEYYRGIYLNWGRYLTGTSPYASPNIFKNRAHFDGSLQGRTEFTNYLRASLGATSQGPGVYEAACLLESDGSSITTFIPVGDNLISSLSGLGLIAGYVYAPALSYTCNNCPDASGYDASRGGTLLRNGQPLLGEDIAMVQPRSAIRVYGLEIRLMFYGRRRGSLGSDATWWSPQPPPEITQYATSVPVTDLYPKDLRLVDIRIKYKLHQHGGSTKQTGAGEPMSYAGSPLFTEIIKIAPRSTALLAY